MRFNKLKIASLLIVLVGTFLFNQQTVYGDTWCISWGCYPDIDGDGIPTGMDSCPMTANSGVDADLDGLDDACDPRISNDDDNDGVLNSVDNCGLTANPGQEDADNDHMGDACDSEPNNPDSDRDGVSNSEDNCPTRRNSDQADIDNDGQGNACDSSDDNDSDSDGVIDESDNCISNSNPDQKDWNGDGEGDVCDLDEPTLETIPTVAAAIVAFIGGGFGMIFFHHYLKNRYKH